MHGALFYVEHMQIAGGNGAFRLDAPPGSGVASFNGILQAWTRQFDWRVEGRGLLSSDYVQQRCRREGQLFCSGKCQYYWRFALQLGVASSTGDLSLK